MSNSENSTLPNGVRTAKQRLLDAQESTNQFVPIIGNSLGRGEVLIIFGPTAVSKTLAAVTIADGLSRGDKKILGKVNEAGKQKVLMYDLEMKDPQFGARYTGYEFDENFLFIDTPPIDHSGEFNLRKFNQQINTLRPVVVIFDNITFLESSSNADANTALKVMKMLQRLVKNMDISVIVIAHTIKSQSGLLKLSDLGGSSNIHNFADNVMGIGFSAEGRDFRYIIDLKQRIGAPSEDVTVCETRKQNGLLGLYFDHMSEAKAQVQSKGSKSSKGGTNTNEKRDRVIHLHLEGSANAEIVKRLDVPKSTVSKYILEYKAHTEQLNGTRD